VENAFSNFNGLEYFFLGCAVIGGFFVLVKLILQFMGGHTDVGISSDIDFDAHHADSDVGFRFLSLHGFSSFLMMFGLVGLALYRQSRSGLGVSIAGAVIAGLFAVWIIGKLFQWATRLQASGNLQTADAVGSTGTVYLSIPAGGTGRVSINFQNHLREFDAVENSGLAVPTGTSIRVIRVNANVLVVERMD
jgi:membrane protein implicated in regulation of membrane protease activity